MNAGAEKVVLINGSPHPHGDAMTLATFFTQTLAVPVYYNNLYDLNIAACRGCMLCRETDICPINDAFPAVLASVLAADCLVLVSPLHFTSLSGPMISFISRLQVCWQRDIPRKNRCGVALVTGGSKYRRMFEPARAVAAAACTTLGIQFLGMAGVYGTDTVPVDDNAVGQHRVQDLARRVKEFWNQHEQI